ncbi:Hypothetical protein BSM4216_3205 [Bacillus smithii]|nr:Hypothetical protein BSM4216_3205 [Bacillus smithii]
MARPFYLNVVGYKVHEFLKYWAGEIVLSERSGI